MNGIVLKSPHEIELMRKANLIVYEVLSVLGDMVKPGVTTSEMNDVAFALCEKHKVRPAFLNYPASSASVAPFPAVICASVNEVIVHGIPNDDPLNEGDIVSIDFGCSYEGYFGDSARTFAVGAVSQKAQDLLKCTELSLEKAIVQCRSANRIGDISHAVQSEVEGQGFSVVREFVGHGIGRRMHEPPHVPNFGQAARGRVLRSGMVLAIEPMVTAGDIGVVVAEDGWTAATKDGSLAAHFEHTIAITDSGPDVLSRPRAIC